MPLAKMSEQYQNFLAPVIKANKLSATNLEALVNFQMNALQSYVDMAMNRMKSAADISDPASLQAFLTLTVRIDLQPASEIHGRRQGTGRSDHALQGQNSTSWCRTAWPASANKPHPSHKAEPRFGLFFGRR